MTAGRKPKHPRFILASASPRRRKLLEDAGFDFTVEAAEVAESLPERGDAAEVAIGNALAKARAIAARHKRAVVVGADTVVSLNGRILGKPADEEDAARILKTLSGTRHAVITGVAIVDASTGRELTAAETTRGTMRKMTDGEVLEYIASGEAVGKAGAYAIQESGDRFIERVEGSFSNVVGFPVERFSELLEEFTGRGAARRRRRLSPPGGRKSG